MSNPALLVIDTDALVQLMIGGRLPLLRELKARYSINSVIVPEVEIEVASSRRFSKYQPTLAKAISNGIVKIFDSSRYASLLQQSASLQRTAAGVSYGDIQSLGATYNLRVDRGEAYTFAAAVRLRQPAMSNDFSAIKALDKAGFALPVPVLRAYDLIVFAFQTKLITQRDCDSFRKSLLSESVSEFIPREMRSNSFVDGFMVYVPRLVDGDIPRCGGPSQELPEAWATELIITQVVDTTP